MIIIHNRFVPFGRKFQAINLFGVLFVKGVCDRITLNHECIHTAQLRECLYVGFYVLYVSEWLVRCVQYRGFERGYLNISFEREAYAHQQDDHYLQTRPRYAFRHYFRRR